MSVDCRKSKSRSSSRIEVGPAAMGAFEGAAVIADPISPPLLKGSLVSFSMTEPLAKLLLGGLSLAKKSFLGTGCYLGRALFVDKSSSSKSKSSFSALLNALPAPELPLRPARALPVLAAKSSSRRPPDMNLSASFSGYDIFGTTMGAGGGRAAETLLVLGT